MITDEIVDAAERAYCRVTKQKIEQMGCSDAIFAALEAVAPLIRAAALEEAAQIADLWATDTQRRAVFNGDWEFQIGQRVRKPKGSWWVGRVVGFYSTKATPRGYAVQMETPDGNGPVQIYPEGALEAALEVDDWRHAQARRDAR